MARKRTERIVRTSEAERIATQRRKLAVRSVLLLEKGFRTLGDAAASEGMTQSYLSKIAREGIGPDHTIALAERLRRLGIYDILRRESA